MWKNFTDKALKVIMYAQEEALRLGHTRITTEIILLGLIAENTDSAAKALKAVGINLEEARIRVEKIVGRGSHRAAVEFPISSEGQHLLEAARIEAQNLGVNYVATGHILLALLTQGDSEDHGLEVLKKLGVDLNKLKQQAIAVLTEKANSPAESLEESWQEEDRMNLDFANTPIQPPIKDSFSKELNKALLNIYKSIHEARDIANHDKQTKIQAWVQEELLVICQKLDELGFMANERTEVLGPDHVEKAKQFIERLKDRRTDRIGPFAGTHTVKIEELIEFAQEEAKQYGHDYVGTEHILLALIRKGNSSSYGIAFRVLKVMGVNIEDARHEVERISGRHGKSLAKEIPFNSRAQKLFECTKQEAKKLGHGYIGREHILLALISDAESEAVEVLRAMNIDMAKLRDEVNKRVIKCATVVE